MGSMKNILIEAEEILDRYEAQLMDDGTSLEGDLSLGYSILLDEHTAMKAGPDYDIDTYDQLAMSLFVYWHKRNFQPPPDIDSKQPEARFLYGLK
jgi:hypothetical protein